MAGDVIYKVYGAFFPVEKNVYCAVEKAGTDAISSLPEPWLFYEKDMVRLSFEGLYFPYEEVLAALQGILPVQASGKLDVLLMQDWRLQRYIWKDGKFEIVSRSLNDMLEPASNYR